MTALSEKGERLAVLALILCEDDLHSATALMGIGCARFLALLSVGHPEVNFEIALKNSLKTIETSARNTRERLLKEVEELRQ